MLNELVVEIAEPSAGLTLAQHFKVDQLFMNRFHDLCAECHRDMFPPRFHQCSGLCT